jgi:D-3-phosphoglycerate dehydrogenase / 2-oxoglutarate reductase
MLKRIRIAEPLEFSPVAVRILQTVGEVELQACSRDELRDAFATYDVVWMRLGHRVNEAILGTSPRCRILATPVTGLDHIDVAACEQRGIRVISLRGEVEFLREVRATAELTVGLSIALMRHIVPAADAVRQGQWNRDLFRGGELYGNTAGIVGMGRLGTLVAGYLRAFGMTVLGCDPRDDFPFEAAERVASLDELLERANLVILLVRYDDSTRHLIGARQFAQMRPGAVLVNTSRGGVVDEDALLAALNSGSLAGAALDVLDGEPNIAADHPLIAYARRHDNLLVVPHIGGNTWESVEKTEVFLAHKVVEALS